MVNQYLGCNISDIGGAYLIHVQFQAKNALLMEKQHVKEKARRNLASCHARILLARDAFVHLIRQTPPTAGTNAESYNLP